MYMIEYFDFAEVGDKKVSIDMILEYGRIRREAGGIDLGPYSGEMRKLNSRLSNSQLIHLLGWSIKKTCENWEAIKVLVPSISPVATADEIASLMEDSLKLADIAKGKEEKKKWDLQQLQ